MGRNGSGPTSTAVVEDGAQKFDQLDSKIDFKNNSSASRTQAQLITTIKAHIAKGDKAAEKAEQHYIAAGQHLKTLKAAHTGTWDEWETLLKTEIGIGKSRASELMQISDGTKTLKRVRADTAKRTADAKARLKLSASSGESVDDPEASAEAMKTAFAADEADQAAQPELYASDPADTTAPQVSTLIRSATPGGSRPTRNAPNLFVSLPTICVASATIIIKTRMAMMTSRRPRPIRLVRVKRSSGKRA